MSSLSPKRTSKVYSSKHKKSRNAALSKSAENDDESASDSGTSARLNKSTPSKPIKRVPVVEIPVMSTPTKPRSLHSRTASGAMGPPTTPARTPGSANLGRSPSVASLRGGTSANGSPAPRKPPSTSGSPVKHSFISHRGSPTPSDSAASATASISAASARTKRKTPADRRAEIEGDPYCREVEPARAFCRTCDAWVQLSDKTPYSTRPWTQHVKEQHASPGTKAARRPRAKRSEDDDEADDASTAAPSMSEAGGMSDRESLMSGAQRKGILKADPRVIEVRAHEVLCRGCSQWVQLHPVRPFDRQRWREHCESCSEIQPSDRVAAAERRLKLVNDSQATDVEAQSIGCKICCETVPLNGPGDYNVSCWEEHKLRGCSLKGSASDERGPGLPTLTIRPPPSVASEGTTAAAERVSQSPQRPTGKRAREDEESEVEGSGLEERPAQRLRTESYTAPVGVWNWLAYPIKSFVAGVRQGMGLAPTDDGDVVEASGTSPP